MKHFVVTFLLILCLNSINTQVRRVQRLPPARSASLAFQNRRLSNTAEREATCVSQQYHILYAETLTGCQTYHVCTAGRKIKFMCPPGTLFSQLLQTCDFWFKVKCEKFGVEPEVSYIPSFVDTPVISTRPSVTSAPPVYFPPSNEEPEWTYAWHKENFNSKNTVIENRNKRPQSVAPRNVERENSNRNEIERDEEATRKQSTANAPNPWLFPGGLVETLAS
ncbi:uncharacterized protein B4U79_09775 [Dinothrombium tinctorium]|uniref:Chitin-binding type-2 domain-containing protein n=1 Tax=Dinothrombium tinctorium TaxID=1965070 RepID=A0A3S3P4M7_9ACAR|nr:uncharacterized protein B4U79_09775 [Dinothrombium tinctorium]